MRAKRKIVYTERVDQLKLNDMTAKRLQECGTDNHLQAMFYSLLATNINKTPINQFAPLKPHIRDKTRESWMIAFQIVNEFLSSSEMKLTLDTMNSEDKKPLKYKSNVAARLHLSSRYPIISELIRSTASYRSLPLKQKLFTYSGEDDDYQIRNKNRR